MVIKIMWIWVYFFLPHLSWTSKVCFPFRLTLIITFPHHPHRLPSPPLGHIIIFFFFFNLWSQVDEGGCGKQWWSQVAPTSMFDCLSHPSPMEEMSNVLCFPWAQNTTQPLFLLFSYLRKGLNAFDMRSHISFLAIQGKALHYHGR